MVVEAVLEGWSPFEVSGHNLGVVSRDKTVAACIRFASQDAEQPDGAEPETALDRHMAKTIQVLHSARAFHVQVTSDDQRASDIDVTVDNDIAAELKVLAL